ncbi:MAG TPA: hypothetical protein VHO69_15570 [Phototrophicaceae bacterium]|nr:hypothetical protein [Phototrophicaceae bacterium]
MALWLAQFGQWLRRRWPLLVIGWLAAACTVVESTGDQTVIQFYNPFTTVGLGPSALRILYLVAGIVLLLVGWRITDYIVALAGFVIGAGVGMSLAPAGNEAVMLLALVAGGFIGAMLAIALQPVAVFLVGAYLGAIITGQAWAAFDPMPIPVWASVLGGVIGGLLMLALAFQLLVLVSAALGALLVSMALGLPLLWTMILFVIGVVIQVLLASATSTPLMTRRRVVRRRYVREPLDV